MNFPNAYNGVKKIFTAEILSLIGTILLILAAILAIPVAVMVTNGYADSAVEQSLGMVAGLAIFGLAGAVLMLIAFIMNLVGIISAKKDEASFNTALIFTIVGIVASALASVFASNKLASSFIQIIVNFSQMMVAYYVVQGIMNLSVRLHDEYMLERGNQVRMYLVIAYSIPILLNVISVILSRSTNPVLSMGLSLAATVVSLVVYIIYLSYLSKAKKMLEN